MSGEGWSFDGERDIESLREPVTKENCGAKLQLLQGLAKISRREIARILGVSEGTLRRIESGQSVPSDEFMLRLHALAVIGVARFGKMSKAEQEQVSALGGVVAGVGGALGAIGSAGSVAGFSAAGITSGLAAIGGTMLAGVGIVAAIPIATSLAGYGLVKAIRAIVEANGLESRDVDGRWEIRAAEAPGGAAKEGD